MTSQKPKRVLVAPLDWGLGHTTRCVPIIEHLIKLGADVWVAGSEWQTEYLCKTFPSINHLLLKGYNVTYSKWRSGFMLSLFQQLPTLLKTIKHERQWLSEQVRTYNFSGVISDNRYGLYHAGIPCVMLTHQLMAQSGMRTLVDLILQQIHYKHINKYNECWVIDVKGLPNLSGKLGHPKKIPKNAQYIGLLSQMEKGEDRQKHLLILLSGPEPQRTILSNILWEQAKMMKDKRIIFVEGKTNVADRVNVPSHISYYERITKEKLQPILNDAALVVCRSGYSTLMDLAITNKPAIIIPTPGQTEQEYLAKHLHKEGVFMAVKQRYFNLKKALADSYKFPFKNLDLEEGYSLHRKTIDDWYHSLP